MTVLQSNKYSLIFGISSLAFLLSVKFGAELISKKCPQVRLYPVQETDACSTIALPH